jgi:hypothetical protein
MIGEGAGQLRDAQGRGGRVGLRRQEDEALRVEIDPLDLGRDPRRGLRQLTEKLLQVERAAPLERRHHLADRALGRLAGRRELVDQVPPPEVRERGHPAGVVAAPQVSPLHEHVQRPLALRHCAAQLGRDLVRTELDAVSGLGLQEQAEHRPVERLDRIGEDRETAQVRRCGFRRHAYRILKHALPATPLPGTDGTARS